MEFMLNRDPFSNPSRCRSSPSPLPSARGQLARFEFLNYDAAAVDSAHQRHKGTYINDVRKIFADKQ